MGILDEAIREHLELKRQRGAEQGELRQLEDEAFGPPARPDTEEAAMPGESPSASAPEAPETQEEPAQAAATPPDPDAIAQQPTEIFDVASELAREKAEETASGDEAAQAEESAEVTETSEEAEPQSESARDAEPEAMEAEPEPESGAEASATASELEVVEAEPQATESEARVDPETPDEPEARVDPETPDEPEARVEPEQQSAEPQSEIFDEQSLSEELDQALEGPIDAEQRRAAFFEETDEFSAPTQRPKRQAPEEAQDTSEEDVLEETPDFLEETPEHDRLWFEQKPPKDFDFND